MKQIIDEISNFHCPRWNELPTITLYMDQVVYIIEESLCLFVSKEENVITSTMINNYVKNKIIAPPEKKKYSKSHLAQLFIISILKRILSMSEISDLISILSKEHGLDNAYNLFCEHLEYTLNLTFIPTIEHQDYRNLISSENPHNSSKILTAALVAFSTKLLVQKYLQIESKDLNLNN